MQHFPVIIDMINQDITEVKLKKRLVQVLYQYINIRELVSYSVRIENFNSCTLRGMKKVARELFISCCLYDQSISPSL